MYCQAQLGSFDSQAGSTAIQQVGNLRYLASPDGLDRTWAPSSRRQALG